jgi:hypothetical protein
MNRSLFSLGIAIGILTSNAAHAAKLETSLGFGAAFYSGEPATYLTPLLGLNMSYGANAPMTSLISWPHHFDFSLLIMGQNLAGQNLTYNGVGGIYSTGIQFNFAKSTVIPFIEAGPMLGIFALYTSGGGTTFSANQTALKYGYYIGSGFDRISGKGRGTGGWGISVTYFNLMPSPSMFEFPAGSVTGRGVRLDFKFIFGG